MPRSGSSHRLALDGPACATSAMHSELSRPLPTIASSGSISSKCWWINFCMIVNVWRKRDRKRRARRTRQEEEEKDEEAHEEERGMMGR